MGHQPQVDNDGQPTSTAYPAATGTAHTDHKPHSGGVQSTGEPAPRPMVQHTDPAAHDDTKRSLLSHQHRSTMRSTTRKSTTRKSTTRKTTTRKTTTKPRLLTHLHCENHTVA